MRSRCRCSRWSAIHTSSRNWLRSSSTHEPSDPPHRVVFLLSSSSSAARKRRPRRRVGLVFDKHMLSQIDSHSICIATYIYIYCTGESAYNAAYSPHRLAPKRCLGRLGLPGPVRARVSGSAPRGRYPFGSANGVPARGSPTHASRFCRLGIDFSGPCHRFAVPVMIHPQVHLRIPCYDFYDLYPG